MSTRENIASNLVTVIGNISSPSVRKVTRQPFELDELSQAQYPAVLIQTIEETKEDQEMGSGAKTRIFFWENSFMIESVIDSID